MSSATAAEWTGMDYAEGGFLDPETVKRFRRFSLGHWLLLVASEWLIIGTALWVCSRWQHWWTWVPAIVLIGTRQHALGILAHESVHYSVTRNRFWNDLLGNYLASYALTYPVQGYRTNHLTHHRWLETPRDPERATLDLYPEEWTFPMARGRFVKLLIRDALGIHQLQGAQLLEYIWRVPTGRWPHILQIGLYQGAAIAVAVATGHPWMYPALWLLPLFTVALMCFRLRTAAEHSALGRPDERYLRPSVDSVASTRTTTPCAIMGFLLAPHHMSYHVEHHLFPSVPVYRLKKLHETLLRNPAFAARVRVTRGYGKLFDELTS